MRKVLGILLALVFVASVARADCSNCNLVAFETWDEFGTPSMTTDPASLGPYNFQVCGSIGCGAVSVAAISHPPWNPSGSGHYLHVVPGGTSAPVPGTGAYLNFGNPQRTLLLGFWFKAEGSFSGPNTYFLRWNTIGGQAFGTDIEAAYFNSTGHIVAPGGTTTNAIADTNWHWVEECLTFGTASTSYPGSNYLTVDGTNWLTATNVSLNGSGIGSNNGFAVPSITLDNEFSNTTLDFGPFLLGYPVGGCSASTLWGHNGSVFATTYLPTGNTTPLQWTPSTGSNYTNVNSTPGGATYNKANVVGYQDCYALTVPTLTTIVAAGEATSVTLDGNGDRLTVAMWDDGSSLIPGIITNGVPTTVGYSFLENPAAISPFTSTTWTAAELRRICIQENN